MEADASNAVQLQRQIRSHGPINTTETTHLNPADCYIRSYDCNQNCNVNASFYTVGLVSREKRKRLVTEISSLLGEYSGDWYAPSLRSHNLPLHPLDWSSTLLQQLCSFAQSFPRNITVEQRLAQAHQAMLKGNCATTGSAHSAEGANTANSEAKSSSTEQTPINDQNVEVELLRAENQRLLNDIQAMQEELQPWIDEVFELRDRKGAFEKATAELSACQRRLSEIERENGFLEQEKALWNLGQVRDVVAQHKQELDFFEREIPEYI